MALDRLQPDDTFNIIQFNSHVQTLFSTARPATLQNITRAKDYVDSLKADGGTEMRPALNLALASGASDERIKQLVFVTDGAIGNEDALLHLIESRLKEQRLFTVAIGSAPNSYFMRKAAQFGRGSHVTIGDSSEVETRMQALFRKIESPVLTSVNVAWPSGTEVYPATIPDLYAGEPVVVAARHRQDISALTITGRLGKEEFKSKVTVLPGPSASGVATLWGRRKIAELTDTITRGGDRSELRAQIVEVGLLHRIVSRFTSFVAVDKTPARPQAKTPVRRDFANLMPAGSAQTIPLPQTAAGLEYHLNMTILLLLLGSAFWGVWRRRQVKESWV